MANTTTAHSSRIIVHGSRKYYTSAVKQRREKASRALQGVNIIGIDEETQSKSFIAWTEAVNAYDLRKLNKVKGPFSVVNYFPQTLQKLRFVKSAYRELVNDYWYLAKSTSLIVETVNDFEFYDSLGYDFTQISRDNFQWIVERGDKNLLRLLLSWEMEEIMMNGEKRIKKYSVPDSIVYTGSPKDIAHIQSCGGVINNNSINVGVFDMELF